MAADSAEARNPQRFIHVTVSENAYGSQQAAHTPRSKDLQSEAMLIRGFLIHTLLPRDYIV